MCDTEISLKFKNNMSLIYCFMVKFLVELCENNSWFLKSSAVYLQSFKYRMLAEPQ